MRRKSDTRFFTVEEATRTLPLVSRIMADIVEENDRLQELLPTLKEVRIRARRSPAAAEELESLRADVAVISTRLVSGRTQVRVLSDQRPDDTFEPVDPDLEDVYFTTLQREPAEVD